MAIEHKDISEADLHEVKGASTAQAGQILIADGAGNTSFKHNLTNSHGEMLIAGYTTALALTAAVDPTLATDSDYVKITGASMWAAGHLDRVTFNVDELVVPDAGGYQVTFWASLDSSAAGALIGVKYAINDTTPYSTRKILTSSKSIGDVENIFGAGIVEPLAANDTISLYIASDTITNVVVKEAGLLISLLDPA